MFFLFPRWTRSHPFFVLDFPHPFSHRALSSAASQALPEKAISFSLPLSGKFHGF